MSYVSTHQRKVRGERIHKDAKERMQDPIQDSFKITREEEETKITREEVEAKYLIPSVENFVETKQVKEVEDRIDLWLNLNYPVHIIGPTGCGKTTLAMHVAQGLGRPVVWINGDESVTTTDLVGGYSQIEQETLRDRYIHNVFKSKDILKADWIDNPLTLACKYGYALVYNEFSRTKPVANNILLSVFEEGILELPTKFGEERYIDVHPDFRAILTSNSIEYAGIHKPQDALLDRMIGIYMDFYDFETEVEIVEAHTGISTTEARRIVEVIRKVREELDLAEKPGTRACIMIGHGLRLLDGYSEKDFEQLFMDIMTSKTKGPSDLSEKVALIRKILRET